MGIEIKSKKSIYVILTLLTFCGLAFRMYGIGQMDFWYDEIDLWIYSLTGDPSAQEPPLMSWLLYIVMWWIKSANSFFIHVLPVILGTLTIPLAFFFSKKVDSSKIAGFIASVLTMISPMAIYYSREGRPYALFILISSCLYLSFIHAYEKNNRLSWVGYSLILLLCCMSHLLAVQVVATLGTFSIIALIIPKLSGKNVNFRIKRFTNFVLFSLPGGCIGSAWILQRQDITSAIHDVYPYGLINYLRTVFVYVGPGPVKVFSEVSIGFAEILSILFFALFILGLCRLHKKGRNDFVLLFCLAMIIPMIFNYFALGIKGGWIWARYISHTLVPYIVVASIGLNSIRKYITRYYTMSLT